MKPEEDADVILMLEFQKGRKSSFDKLFQKFHRPLINYVNRFMGVSCLPIPRLSNDLLGGQSEHLGGPDSPGAVSGIRRRVASILQLADCQHPDFCIDERQSSFRNH